MLCACGCAQETKIAIRTDATKGWVAGQPLQYIRYHRKQKPWKSVDGIPLDIDRGERSRLMNNRRARLWYQANSATLKRTNDNRKEYKREWREQNKERLNAADKQRYWDNRERHLASAAEWRQNNSARVIQYRADNKEVLRDGRRRSYLKHRKKRLAEAIAGKARRRGATGSHTLQEWEALVTFYGHRCLCCGRREPKITLTRDHVIPVTKGGTDNIDNIQPLCGPCNSTKRTRCTDYRLLFSPYNVLANVSEPARAC